jgi:hypothetical protein
MATSQPILTPEQRLAREQQERYKKIGRGVAIGGVIICPIIALLPPRKLDLYTFALGACFYLSADHLSTDYNGRGIIENLKPKWTSTMMDLPTEKAKETQLRLENEKRLREGREALKAGSQIPKEKGILDKLWMGDEEEGWKERRLAEERKALQEGKGFGSMIMEQIWEVWNWDKKKNADDNSTNVNSAKEEPNK